MTEICQCCGQAIKAKRATKRSSKSKFAGMYPAPVYEALLDDGEVVRMSYWSHKDQALRPDRGRRLVMSLLTEGRRIVCGYVSHNGAVAPDDGLFDFPDINGHLPFSRALQDAALSAVTARAIQAWRSYRGAMNTHRAYLAECRQAVEAADLNSDVKFDRSSLNELRSAKHRLRQAERDTRPTHWRAIALACLRSRRLILARLAVDEIQAMAA